eukprot:4584523-Amphidinium_carterae.1
MTTTTFKRNVSIANKAVCSVQCRTCERENQRLTVAELPVRLMRQQRASIQWQEPQSESAQVNRNDSPSNNE